MMKLHYDFHIHSCLSPCGDNEMTPFNLVNLAKLLGYDIIALTDHNSTKNCKAAIEVGKEAGITVVPGMELCTSEEIHAVCLFDSLQNANSFGDYVYERIPKIKNKTQIFGDQLVTDSKDNIIGTEEILLTTASSIGIDALPKIVASFGGVCFPAHIDRSSYSIISALGTFSSELSVGAFELTKNADECHYLNNYPGTRGKLILKNSDAHYLESLLPAENTIDLCENSATALIERLKNYEAQ